MARLKLALVLATLTLLLVSAGLASHYHANYELELQRNAEQQKTLAQQSGLISTLRADDARNRAMMAEQQRREQQLRQRGEIYQRKYEDAIKNDECARHAAPVAVLDLLRGKDTATTGADRSVAP